MWKMTPHLYVILANLTLYIAFYVILNIYCILMVDVSHIGFGGKEGDILKQESFLFVML